MSLCAYAHMPISLYAHSRIVVQAYYSTGVLVPILKCHIVQTYYISCAYMTDKLSLCFVLLQKLAYGIVISRWRYAPYSLPLSRLCCLHYHACVVCEMPFVLFALSRWRYGLECCGMLQRLTVWQERWYARARSFFYLSLRSESLGPIPSRNVAA